MDNQQNTNQPAQPSTSETASSTPAAPAPDTTAQSLPTPPPAMATATPGTTTVAPSSVPPVATIPNSPTAPKGKSNMIFIILSIILVLIIAGALAYLFMHKSTPAPQAMMKKETMKISPTVASQPTPAITPVTKANVDQALNNTDNSLQQASTQVNTDLNSINSVAGSQDSTSGL